MKGGKSMNFDIRITTRDDELLNVITCETKDHPEISMITSKEHIAEDFKTISNLQNNIISNNLQVCDHYLLIHETTKSVFGFIITEPGKPDRLRLVIINRPFYDKEIKDGY